MVQCTIIVPSSSISKALIIADQNHVAVKVIASEKEHPLITANPAEKYLN